MFDTGLRHVIVMTSAGFAVFFYYVYSMSWDINNPLVILFSAFFERYVTLCPRNNVNIKDLKQKRQLVKINLLAVYDNLVVLSYQALAVIEECPWCLAMFVRLLYPGKCLRL